VKVANFQITEGRAAAATLPLDGIKKKDASVGYDKSVSIMRFLIWHNKTPVDVS
jgi:hypothetical protein